MRMLVRRRERGGGGRVGENILSSSPTEWYVAVIELLTIYDGLHQSGCRSRGLIQNWPIWAFLYGQIEQKYWASVTVIWASTFPDLLAQRASGQNP